MQRPGGLLPAACVWQIGQRYETYAHEKTVRGDGGWNGAWHRYGEHGYRGYKWTQKYANEFPNGLACSVYGINTFEDGPLGGAVSGIYALFSFETVCWTQPVFKLYGEAYRRYWYQLDHERFYNNEEATSTLLAAIAGDRPGPEPRPARWGHAESVHSSHTNCLQHAENNEP